MKFFQTIRRQVTSSATSGELHPLDTFVKNPELYREALRIAAQKLALEMMASGESVQFLLDDGEAVKNVPRSLKAEGHKLLGLQEVDGHYLLTLEKGEE